MHPRIQEVLTELDTRRTALTRAVASVPPELRERRPAPERWSVAEVLEHLALVEGLITGVLKGLIESAREAGLGLETETGPLVSTLNLSRVLDRTRPLVASENLLPSGGLDAEAAEAALAEKREALRAVVLSADGLALAEVSGMNPVIGPLNGYEWVLFVSGHEGRHTEQIREIAAALHDAPPHLPAA